MKLFDILIETASDDFENEAVDNIETSSVMVRQPYDEAVKVVTEHMRKHRFSAKGLRKIYITVADSDESELLQ